MKRLTPLIALLSSLFFLLGCGGNKADSSNILILGNGSEPRGLDPHIVTGVTENNIITALIEGLIAYHPTDDSTPYPGVAERWEANEDNSVWTFFFRDNASWSNGDPVTAQDFVFSFQRMLSPALAADYADMLYYLKNGEEFHKGQITDPNALGVRAIDDLTLEITLKGPVPFFPLMLKHYAWFPVHPATILKHGAKDQRDTQWTRPENFVGNGPFTLSRWRTNEVIEVLRSETYWDRETVRLDGIRFLPINDPNTEERAFRRGNLHLANTVAADRIDFFLTNHPDWIRIEPYLGTYFYRFNVTRAPLNDARVRLALNLAVDRRAIVENITMGGQQPAFGYTPPFFDDFNPAAPLSYDPERARELLAEAGFPNGEGFPRKGLLFNTLEAHRQIAEAIQQMWKENLGIDIILQNQEWRVYLDTQTRMDYDLARAGWIGDFMDPITFLDMWTTGDGNNNTGWSNPEYDRLIRQARVEPDAAARLRILEAAEAILMEDLPIIPLYFYTRIYLLSPRVQGWYPKAMDNRPYKHVWLLPE
jgi:oligopeptide transport system substrate-binding protein